MACLPDTKPVNPINSILLSVFGDNYFPLYNTAFQPSSRSDLTNEKLLEIQTPGGGKLKPSGTPDMSHMSEVVSTVMGPLGSVFAFFGPIFLILDLIRAIIDMICSLFNPIPLIAVIVETFLTVVPPIIALYPPLSSILLGINTAKVVVATSASMLSAMTPIAETIVDNALHIPEQLQEGNLAAVESIQTKICILLNQFLNQIGGFSPLSFIIELLNIFMELGSKFFCLSDSKCCDPENCPPVIINPPQGRATVSSRIESFTLADLLNIIFAQLNVPLGVISQYLNEILPDIFVILNQAFDEVNKVIGDVNDLIADAIGPINTTLEDVVDKVLDLAEIINTPLLGALDDFIEDLEVEVPDIPAGVAIPTIPELSAPTVDLTLTAPEFAESIFFIKPEMTLEFTTNAVSGPNPNGIVSEKGVGEAYDGNDIIILNNYVVEPDKIPGPSSEEEPATIRVRMVNRDTGESVTAPATFAGFNFLQVRDDTFPDGSDIDFYVEPDQINLLKLNLIGLGCFDDVASVTQGIATFIDAAGGLDPLADKIGRTFPLPPVKELEECADRQEEDPTVSQAQCAADVINEYIDEVTGLYEDLVCEGANGIQSEFKVSKNYVTADKVDYADLSFRIKDVGGVDIASNPLPGADLGVVFDTDLGEIESLPFDEATGTYKARIRSDTKGKASVTAKFLVRGQECMFSQSFDGFAVSDEQREVFFRDPPQKRRRRNQYVQSRGGRRR